MTLLFIFRLLFMELLLWCNYFSLIRMGGQPVVFVEGLMVNNASFFMIDQVFLHGNTGETQKVAIIDFDEESYVSVNCSISTASDGTTPTSPATEGGSSANFFVPCCDGYNNITTLACYEPPSGYICMDNKSRIFEIIPYNVGEEALLISFKVKNPNSCSGFGVSVMDSIGSSIFSLCATQELEISVGPPSSFWCCSTLYSSLFPYLGRAWDGNIFLKIVSYLWWPNTNCLLQVIVEPEINKLPTKYFWNLVQVEWVDNSISPPVTLVPSEMCQGNAPITINLPTATSQSKCNFQYPPRDDPLYYYYKKPSYVLIPDVLPNRLVFAYYELILDFSESITTNNTLQSNTVRLLNVVDKNGNLLLSDVVTLSQYFKKGSSCSYSKFKVLYDEFDLLLAYLTTQQKILPNEFIKFLSGVVLAPLTSTEWLGCDYHVKYFLSSPTIFWTPSNTTTTECTSAFNSIDYATNPCCNISLLDTQCCVPQSTLNKNIFYSPQVLNSTNCLVPQCATESLNQVNTFSYSSLNELYHKCPQISELSNLPKSLSGGNTDVSLLDLCRHFIGSATQCYDGQSAQLCFYYSGGITESECLYSLQKVPLTTSWDCRCNVPCMTDNDCLFGSESIKLKCRIHGSYNTCEPIEPPHSNFWLSPEAVNPLISCIAGYITDFDQRAQYKIYSSIQFDYMPIIPPSSPSKLALDIALKQYLLKQDCSYTEFKIDATCDTSETRCNWINGPQKLNFFDCIDVPPPMNKDGFCGLCSEPNDNSSSCAQLSQNGECIWGNEYAQYDLDKWGLQFTNSSHPLLNYSKVFCEEQLGGFIYHNRLGCMLANFTQNTTTTVRLFHGALTIQSCLLDQFCGVTDRVHDVADGMDHNLIYGETCEAYCYWDQVNESTCIQHNFQWLNWTKNGMTYSKCLVPGTFFSHCDAWNRYKGYKNVSWWPGAAWFPPMFNTPETCKPFCRYNISFSQDKCISNSHCSNPLCLNCDRETCERSGLCAVQPGCYIEYDENGSCDQFDLSSIPELNGLEFQWFPWGCRVAQYIRPNEITCKRISEVTKKEIFFLSYSQWATLTQSECESLGWKYCELASPFIYLSQVKLDPTDKIYDSLSPAACKNCGGHTKPKIRWQNGIWIESTDQWMDVTWRTRQYIPLYNITDTIDQYKFSKLLGDAANSIQLQLFKAFLLCKEGNMKNVLLQLACLTGDDRHEHEPEICLNTYEAQRYIGETTLCSHLPTTYNYIQFGTFSVTEDFKLYDFACILNNISLLLESEYKLKVANLYRRIPVPSTQTNKGQFQSVTNAQNVIVGEMIGNGVTIGLYDPSGINNPPYVGLQACLILRNLQTTSSPLQGREKLWIGVADYKLTKLEPIDQSLVLKNITDSTQICFIVTETITVFPISLQIDYESITYISTFSSVEMGMLCFGFTVYSIVVLLGIIVTCQHVYLFEKIDFFKGGTESFAAVSIASLRLVFWSMILYETSNQEVAFIFLAEFPALILFAALTLVISKLAIAYHSSVAGRKSLQTGKMAYFLLILVIFITVLFIFVLIFTALYPQKISYRSCFGNSLSSMSPPDIVALVYLIIFLITCLFMIGTLIFYTTSLIDLLLSSSRISIKPLVFVAFSGSLSLLAQCFYIIVQIVQSWEWDAVAITTYLIVVDLHTLLLLLHYSNYANRTKKGKRGGSSAATPNQTPVPHQFASQTQSVH